MGVNKTNFMREHQSEMAKIGVEVKTVRRKKNFWNSLCNLIIYAVLILISIAVIYPLIYTVAGAFSPGEDIGSITVIPFKKGFTLDHFRELFKNTEYGLWFKNSFIIAACTSIFTVITTTLSAYVFSRFRFAAKKPLLMSFMILETFPSFLGMIALYVIVLKMGGYNELWGLILIYVAANIPYNTWMIKSYIDTVPLSLDEAAKIDGASNIRIFRQVVFPLAKPMVIFLGITSFTAPWMDFIFPKFLLRTPDKMTVAIGLYNMISDKKDQFTLFAAGALIVAIPFMIFFMMTQRMMITSLAGAAVKE